MFQKKSNSYSRHQGLKTILYCPNCNSHYNPLDTRVLEEKDNTHLIHLECTECGSSVVALVMTGGLGVTSIGLITDLTPGDVLKFKNSELVSLDDVIEMHSILKNDLILMNNYRED